MPPVVAVLLIVSCDPSLLFCSPLEPWHRTWASTEDCRAARPAIRDTAARRAGPGRVVMAQCRLYLDDGPRKDRRPTEIGVADGPRPPAYDVPPGPVRLSPQGGFFTNRSTSQSMNARTLGAWWRPGG
jgi:hypothetical protein